MIKTEKQPCAILAISQGACGLGEKLALDLGADFFPCKGKTAQVFREVWSSYQALICIMASGIVIRSIAPLLASKYQDPAVVLCDEKGKFAVSLLSGHLGGANALTRRIATITGGQAVISTASDVLGRLPLDLWCKEQGLVPANTKKFTQVMARLVDQGWLAIAGDYPLPPLPPDLHPIEENGMGENEAADLFVTIQAKVGEAVEQRACLLHPQALTVGIGCNRGVGADAIAAAVQSACKQHNLAAQSIHLLASIDLKEDENGLLTFAESWGRPLFFYSAAELNQVTGVSASAVVLRYTGARAVAEPAALLAAGAGGRLLAAKIKQRGVTVAIAETAR